MIFQYPEFFFPSFLLLDIFAVGLLILTIFSKKKFFTRMFLGLSIFVFLVTSLFKLMSVKPHSIPSSPVDIEIQSDKYITSFYYVGEVENEKKVFWKEIMFKKNKERMFDLESSIHDSLIIAKKFSGDWKFKSVKLDWNIKPKVNLMDSEFQFDRNGEIEKAVKKYRKIEYGNYFSNLLTIAFFILVIWRIRKYNA
ncbi:hypothetical protein ACFLSE_09195 [Bacteroidota bacterium]